MVLLLLLFVSSPALGAEPWQAVVDGLQARPLLRSSSVVEGSQARFTLMPPSETGIDLVNRLDWDHPQGLLFETGYACGGLAVGDVDGNGLPDLLAVSALGRNCLYLQKKPWQFEEAAAQVGMLGDEKQPLGGDGWGTGVALFDVDNDGDLDIYICNYDAPNVLYINRRESGTLKFEERAADYGLDIIDASLMPSVADYDRDGDLDIYLAANRYCEEKQFRRKDLFYWHDGKERLRPAAKKHFAIRQHYNRAEQINMWSGRSDRLLRNEGPGKKFVDVSKALCADGEKMQRGDTLSATWWDYDHDGWPDLYVATDLAAPDQLFRNLGNGSFENVTLESLPHTPWQGMGSSVGDINNDGLVDCLVADMAFRTHFKDKMFMGDMSAKFRNIDFFPHRQLMRNALFLNTGADRFQETAYLSGLASTDWTWGVKLADFDNDGQLDAFFTNGSPVNLSQSPQAVVARVQSNVFDTSLIRKKYRELPPVLEQNLVYRNQGNLKFVDQSESWGLADVGMSFAAVHADLDRDGDLDLVVANLEKPLSVYRNNSQANGLLVELRSARANRLGVGAELMLETDQGRQVRQVFPVAGFQSCQEAIVHFGLDAETKVRRLQVRWPSGGEQVFEELEGGRHYLVSELSVSGGSAPPLTPSREGGGLFSEVKGALVAEHHEEPFDDFARQPLLPNRLSQLGPPMAWGDVDDDGDADLFLGEGTGWMGMLYLNRNEHNQGSLQFTAKPLETLARDAQAEDRAAVFLDANADGRLDLYVGSGGVECEPGDERLCDRLYLGDGAGGFQAATETWLPDLRISTGAVAACDFDRDGDEDLFVGGRSVPGAYPVAPQHALLRNVGNRFEDVLAEVAGDLSKAGMVTAAAWVDVDGDGWQDLVVTIDWGPVRLYLNKKGKLIEATATAGLKEATGWWQSLACADLDNDGDIDFVAGNFGENTKYKATRENPVLAYYGDYDDSGRRNFIEASYEGEQLFPLRGKSCSSAAMPHLTARFKTYEAFASATLPEIYTPGCLQRAEKFSVNTLASTCFVNDGTGKFTLKTLPRAAQLAPVFAIAVTEVNGDGVADLFVGQNFLGPQRETGPMAGGVGVIALGKEDGTFEALRPDHAGVVVAGDAKAAVAVDLDGDGRLELCVAVNNGPLQMFRHTAVEKLSIKEEIVAEPSSWVRENLALAQQFIVSGESERGLPYLRRALKAAPRDWEAVLLLAKVRREQRRFDNARQLLLLAHEQSEANQEQLLVEEARVWLDMKRYEEAAEVLQSVLTESRLHMGAHRCLGDVRLKQGKLMKAKKHFEQARAADRLQEVEKKRQVARLFFEQGLVAQQAGDEADAVRWYEKSRRVDARPQTLRALAEVLLNSRDEELRDPWLAKQLLRWAGE